MVRSEEGFFRCLPLFGYMYQDHDIIFSSGSNPCCITIYRRQQIFHDCMVLILTLITAWMKTTKNHILSRCFQISKHTPYTALSFTLNKCTISVVSEVCHAVKNNSQSFRRLTFAENHIRQDKMFRNIMTVSIFKKKNKRIVKIY